MRFPALGRAAVFLTLVAIVVPTAGGACMAEPFGHSPDRIQGSDFQERLWIPRFPAAPDTAGSPGNALRLNSTPFGATVRLDGKILGVTPLWIHRACLENGILEISFPGYRTVPLARESAGSDVVTIRMETSGTSSPRPVDDRNSLGFRRRPLRVGLLLLGSGSAALGLHFKDQADEAYDEYLHTGNDRRIRTSADRAERYDRCALGCWLVAELSLIGFLYLLMDTPGDETWSVDTGIDGAGDECGLILRWQF